MLKRFLCGLAAAFIFSGLIGNTVSAAESGAGVSIQQPTTRNVMTDMVVPPTCLDSGKTICAQLPANSTRQLLWGAACYKLRNKTTNDLFVPLRTDFEIEQFLLNAPTSQIGREPCPQNN